MAPHDVEERGCRVLQQVPSVRHLQGLRRSGGGTFLEADAAIAAHHLDVGPLLEPRRDGAALTIGQQVDDTPLLQVADDRAVALTLLPGEIVDADDPHPGGRRCRTSAQQADQRVGGHRRGQSFGELLARAPAESHRDDVQQIVKAGAAPRVHDAAARAEPLGEDLAVAVRRSAPETAGRQSDREPPSMSRQVKQAAVISTVNCGRGDPAGGADAEWITTKSMHHQTVWSDVMTVDDSPARVVGRCGLRDDIGLAFRRPDRLRPWSHSGFILSCTKIAPEPLLAEISTGRTADHRAALARHLCSGARGTASMTDPAVVP